VLNYLNGAALPELHCLNCASLVPAYISFQNAASWHTVQLGTEGLHWTANLPQLKKIDLPSWLSLNDCECHFVQV
jgi:hypothetical protein